MLVVTGNGGGFTFGAPVAAESHRYWRFEFSSGIDTIYAGLQELEFYDAAGNITSAAAVTSAASFTPVSGGVAGLTDGDITTEPGLMLFTYAGARRLVDFDFGAAKSLDHLRVHDRADNGGIYSESGTSRSIGVYYSDDGVTYTLYFVGYFTPDPTGGWHIINAPHIAGVMAASANLWVGLYAQKAVDGKGNYTIQELEYLAAAVVKVGASALPVTNLQTSQYSASYDVSKVFSGSTARWNSQNVTPQCAQLLIHEIATPTLIDQIKLTSTTYGNAMVEEFALVAGNGTTFVPLLEVTGQTGWTNGEVRTFSV